MQVLAQCCKVMGKDVLMDAVSLNAIVKELVRRTIMMVVSMTAMLLMFTMMMVVKVFKYTQNCPPTVPNARMANPWIRDLETF